MTRADWILRPILWFATAAAVNVIAYRGSHATATGVIFDVACLAAYSRLSRSAAGLPLLYLSTGGIAMFLAHRVSSPLLDAASAATSLAAALGSAALFFWQGRELQQWIPRPAGRIFGVIAVTVMPLIFWTGIAVLAGQRAPTIDAALGIFAIIGAATGARRSTGGRSFRLWWMDGTVAIATALILWILTHGIH